MNGIQNKYPDLDNSEIFDLLAALIFLFVIIGKLPYIFFPDESVQTSEMEISAKSIRQIMIAVTGLSRQFCFT